MLFRTLQPDDIYPYINKQTKQLCLCLRISNISDGHKIFMRDRNKEVDGIVKFYCTSHFAKESTETYGGEHTYIDRDPPR